MNEPSDKRVLSSALGWIGVMLVFVFILAVTYWPNQAPSIDAAVAADRSQKVAEIKAKQLELTTKYAVEADGSLRIPVDQAMELVIPELNKKLVKSSD